ncbi:MAG: c-type cytochrome [Rhodocyclaceae bacterium]|nr:c-type cytochrome [Rhodocyclaceae bacterium]
MKFITSLALICALASSNARADAPGSEPLTPGSRLAAGCAACHGTRGISAGGIPSLAGLEREAILQALESFASGTRPATVMHHHARGYSTAERTAIAEYFASQKVLLKPPLEALQ